MERDSAGSASVQPAPAGQGDRMGAHIEPVEMLVALPHLYYHQLWVVRVVCVKDRWR